jgi:hypothetical protein
MRRMPPTACAFSVLFLALAGDAFAQKPAVPRRPEPGAWTSAAPAPASPAAAPEPPADLPDLPPAAAEPPPPGSGPAPGYGPPPGHYSQPWHGPEGYGPAPGYSPPGYGPAPYAVPYAPPPIPDPTAHLHDGFYLRMSIGVGYMGDSVSYSKKAYSDMTVRGGAGSFAILLGGTPRNGLVVGGGIVGVSADRPVFDVGRDSFVHDGKVTFSMLSGFVDWYPNPREGFHLQALAGLGVLTFEDSVGNTRRRDPAGVGLGLAIGQEWWVGSQWSIGVIGRLMYAHLTLKDADDIAGLTEKHSLVSPAVLFGATYH